MARDPEKKSISAVSVMLFTLLIVLPLSAMVLFGSPTKSQRAAAMVLVSIAQIEAADEHAELPDQPPRIVRSEPMRIEFTQPAQQQSSDDEISWDRYRRTVLQRSIDEEKPLFVVLGAEWCGPCHRLDDETFLDPEIRRIVNEQFIAVHIDVDADKELAQQFFHATKTRTIPLIVVVDPNVQHSIRKSQAGFQTAEQLRSFLGVESQSYAASGPAGSIHASSQIRSTLSWWRTNIGEGNKVESGWDRTGAQTFPLLAKGDWSYQAVFGNFGRFRFSAPGSKLPVTSGEFVYTVEDGWPIIKSVGPIPLKPILESFTSEQGYAADPSGIGPATILTVLSVFRDLWSLLHPTCDLQLGGNVTATAVLLDDTLVIDFQQCPSVKLVELFTFQLSVQRVEIREESVRVVFGGSRLIKERTFNVQ